MEMIGTTEKIRQIVEDFRENVHPISDEEVEKVKGYCRAKMELTGKEDDYIVHMLPDELKNYCYRIAVNTISMLIAAKEKRKAMLRIGGCEYGK
jgi:hypothetical protein